MRTVWARFQFSVQRASAGKIAWLVIYKLVVLEMAFCALLEPAAYHDPTRFGNVWTLIATLEEKELVQSAIVALMIHGAAEFHFRIAIPFNENI